MFVKVHNLVLAVLLVGVLLFAFRKKYRKPAFGLGIVGGLLIEIGLLGILPHLDRYLGAAGIVILVVSIIWAS